MIDVVAWELSPVSAAYRGSRTALWTALKNEAARRGAAAMRGDVRVFVGDLLQRSRPDDIALVRQFPPGWQDRTELLLNSAAMETLIKRSFPVPVQSAVVVPSPRVLAADGAWRSLLAKLEKATGHRIAQPAVIMQQQGANAISLVATTYNGRTETQTCLGSCSERDVRAWRLAARRWLTLAETLRARLLEKWGAVEKWPVLAKGSDLAYAEAQKLSAAAKDSLSLDHLATYIGVQKSARLAVKGYQLGQGDAALGGLLFELVEPTFGRWGPITGFGNATVGYPCTGLLDVCTDQDVYGWEYVAKSHNGSASKLREAVVMVFGENASGWPPLVRWGEFSYTEAQAVLNGDLGWSDGAKVYSFADAQALVKDALEIWSRAIAAQTGKDVDYQAPDPNKDPQSIPEPHVPKLPDLFGGLRKLGYVVGGAAVVTGAAVIYTVTRKPKTSESDRNAEK